MSLSNPISRRVVSRRTVLRTASTGFGYLALAGLAAEQARKEARGATNGATEPLQNGQPSPPWPTHSG